MSTFANAEISFEFFPPRSEQGFEKMIDVHRRLAELKPSFFSVTYGAGGSTQQGTYESIAAMHSAGSNAAPHLTCVGTSKQLVEELLQKYLALGVTRMVILRGDIPSGVVDLGEFAYASELVSFVRDVVEDQLHIEVAAYPDFHPESRSPKSDIRNFKNKVDAGANSAITQYFYNADSYFAFVDEARRLGVEVPIVPGIMPITNFAALMRFSDKCGAEIPRWIRSRLEQYQDDEESLTEFGLDVVTRLCFDLLENDAPGIHFYALNRARPALEVCRRLGIGTA